MEQDCFMASIDIKDAYYSFSIHPTDRKYLCFEFNGQLYCYKSLPNGLSSAPRKFTKLLKVPLSYLHEQGHISLGHLDDFYLQGKTYNQCVDNVINTVQLFAKLGLISHPDKCNFIPSQTLVILGFALNSKLMTVKLTEDKATSLKHTCQNLLHQKSATIREVARVIGKLVSSFPGTMHGPLYYRKLDRDKTQALKVHKGDFDALMTISQAAKSELTWWVHNIMSAFNLVSHGPPIQQVTTDASLQGWGAECNNISTGGPWTIREAQHHINYLEMLAAFIGLKTFVKDEKNIHVRIRLDNTTGVYILNHMGSSHSTECNDLCKTIWEWCIARNIWLSAAYLPGTSNITADRESREKNHSLEWMLNKQLLQIALQQLRFQPDIDLFASRVNNQFVRYAAYRPDPNAIAVDAFTMQWTDLKFYAFPPFSVVSKVLSKICQEKAEGIVVLPNWPTQSWFAKAKQMLVQPPVYLKPQKNLLSLPPKPMDLHPLHAKLSLIVCHLSAKH